jgi:hypothetical protein
MDKNKNYVIVQAEPNTRYHLDIDCIPRWTSPEEADKLLKKK